MFPATAGTGVLRMTADAPSLPPPLEQAHRLPSEFGPGTVPEARTLLDRMRGGDREAAAKFMASYGDLIRRRVRGKLSPAVRRMFDSLDIVSTIGRRLDRFVRNGGVKAIDEKQLWKLVFEMSELAVVDKVRAFKRLEQAEREDSPIGQLLLSRMRDAEDASAEGPMIELERVLRMLKSDHDRQLLTLWLRDVPLFRIADMFEAKPAAIRDRWREIREHLRTELEAIER